VCLDENYYVIKWILFVYSQFRIGLVLSYITNIYKCSHSRTVWIAQVLCNKKQDDCWSNEQECQYFDLRRRFHLQPCKEEANITLEFLFLYQIPRAHACTHIGHLEKLVSMESGPCSSINFRDIKYQSFRDLGEFVLHSAISNSLSPERI